FDFSPQGCTLLSAGHVSRTILNAIAAPSQPPCISTSESSKLQTGGAGTLLGNGNATLLGDDSKKAQLTSTAPSSGGDRVTLNPQPLPPRAAANAGGGSPGANVAQATAAVSDYHQPPGAKPSGRVLLPPAYRNAARQHTASASGKTTPPVGMVKAGPAGSAPL